VTKKKIFDLDPGKLYFINKRVKLDFFLFSVLEKRERKYGIGTKLDLDL
jgi:hypothetical protein